MQGIQPKKLKSSGSTSAVVNWHMAFESTEPYQLMEAEGLINISPGKEGKHVVSPWLLSVVQYQLNICINREPFSRKKYSLIFFKFICLDEISVFSSVLEQK